MTDHLGADRPPPVAAALATVTDALASTADAPVWALDGPACRDLLVQLTQAATQLTELTTRVAHQADVIEAGPQAGATSTPTWWAHTTRQPHAETHRTVALGADLDRHDLTRESMTRGEVNPAQARVIIDAVHALPADTDLRERCEKHLIVQAATFGPRELRRLGRRVLEVVDPEAAEAHEAALLEAEERRAEKTTTFSMHRDGHGAVQGRFVLPELQGAMLEKALRAIAAPKHVRAEHGPGAYDHARPTPERLGQAFAEYVERFPATGLPEAGGVAATVVITMDLDTLTGGLGAAALDNGERLSAAAARRLACEAGLVPMVLGSRSVVLDQGRRTRFHTEAQRLALIVTQRHCQAAGCDVPGAMCHTHHTTPWSRGGHTNIRDAQLLCPRHHAREHRRLDRVARR